VSDVMEKREVFQWYIAGQLAHTLVREGGGWTRGRNGLTPRGNHLAGTGGLEGFEPPRTMKRVEREGVLCGTVKSEGIGRNIAFI